MRITALPRENVKSHTEPQWWDRDCSNAKKKKYKLLRNVRCSRSADALNRKKSI